MKKIILPLLILLVMCGLAFWAVHYFGAIDRTGAPSVVKNSKAFDSAPEEEQFMRAVFFSYIDLASFVSRGQLEEELTRIVSNLKRIEATDLFLQIRAFGDACYPSLYYQSIKETYCPNAEGDYLRLFCDALTQEGIRVWAWINPYRLYKDADVFADMSGIDPAAILSWDGRYYLDPSNEQTKKIILTGIEEVLQAYPIEGILFDDYFYPTTDQVFDADSYELYCSNDGSLTLEEWRRGHVLDLIRSVQVQTSTWNRKFAISPDGVLSRNINVHYLDIKALCEEGLVDFICPQIYYGFLHETAPFEETTREWVDAVGDVPLVIALAFSKTGTEDSWAGRGKEEWQQYFDIIARQSVFSESQERCKGIALYRYDSLFEPSELVAVQTALQLEEYLVTIEEK